MGLRRNICRPDSFYIIISIDYLRAEFLHGMRVRNWMLSWLILVLACGRVSDRVDISGQNGAEYRLVVDMRGKEIRVPAKLERIATVSDGLVETVFAHLGKIETIVALGSTCVQRVFNYRFPVEEGVEFAYSEGMNPVALLYPEVRDLPLVASSGTALNYEALAVLNPQLLIARIGSCTLGSWDDDNTRKTLERVEALGIPVVVLMGPPCFSTPTISYISEEIRILGQLFGMEAEALELSSFLEDAVDIIRQRIPELPEAEKPSMLLLGLSPLAREGGGAGNTRGRNTIESYFIEEIINARNAYSGPGGRSAAVLLSTEQVYGLDPDVIVLPTASGYHPPEELYTAPYYQGLRLLRAVQQRRIYALPWTPCNCSKRVEYPLELLIMAKAAYPMGFADLTVHEWALDFYQKVYGVDREGARRIRSAQWLDWTVESDF